MAIVIEGELTEDLAGLKNVPLWSTMEETEGLDELFKEPVGSNGFASSPAAVPPACSLGIQSIIILKVHQL